MTPDFTEKSNLHENDAMGVDTSVVEPLGDTSSVIESFLEGVPNPITLETQVLEGRKRRLSASITVPHSLENLWQILTAYDQLADFIPSLKESRRIDDPAGNIRIEQIGSQSFLKLKFCARVVLDMFEEFPHRIGFQMVDGDFKEFYGAWLLSPTKANDSSATSPSTQLTYTLNVLPSRLMPVSVIEKKLSHNLQVNLAAISHRADALFR
ncbi:MAG: SRPBCC family protein [Leptolyngbyaceae bacterium]|nr:SRPBCC family protein [Leptolyngbyaceae bacterium]